MKTPRHKTSNDTVTDIQPTIPVNPALLQFCWHIRIGLARNVEIKKIKSYADFFYQTYLINHLNSQEQLLAGGDLPASIVKKAVSAHRRLKRLFEEQADAYRSLARIEDCLEQYARFEQRELFRELRSVYSRRGNDIERLGRQFYDPSLQEKLRSWDDKYWSLN